MMNNAITRTLLIASIAACAACEEQAPPPTSQGQSSTAPAQAQAPAPSASPGGQVPASNGPAMSVAGVSFPVPEGWAQVQPANSMRAAQLDVTHAETGEVCSAAFSLAGGDVRSNISRWAMQVVDANNQPVQPVVETRTINGLTAHLVELRGTYLGMGQSPAQPNSVVLGAIIETNQGLLFVKMTGSAAAMDAARPAWDSMITGIKPG